MTLGNFFAFAIFCIYPCMPPRLLPDSYHFFDRLGDLVKTGPTNTNVMDVRLVLVGE